MADNVDPKLIDKRTADRFIKAGQLDEAAYIKAVKALPDVADKAVTIETVMNDEEDDA